MNDTGKTPQQRQLLATVRRYVREVVLPVAAALDARVDPEDCFSWEIVEQGDRIGLRTLSLEPENGGLGLDALTIAMVIEELARGDIGVGVIFAQTLKIAKLIEQASNAEQKKRFLPRYVSDPRALVAICVTEPESGSDNLIPFAEKRLATKAVRTSGGWIINGAKHFVSDSNRASPIVLFAQTEPAKPSSEGATVFLVERGTAGFTVGRVHNKMGERLVNNAELFFEDCFVPDENVLGEVNRGFELLGRFLPPSNIWAAATVLGAAESAYQQALEWARTRVQGGRHLIDHDTIAMQLAEMRMLLDAARAFVHRGAYALDHLEEGWDPRDPSLVSLPKVFASQAAWKVVTMTMEMHGGYGFMREVGVEKLMRDIAAFLHSDGTNLALQLRAARFIRGGAGG